jgi:hypothetical protein
MEVHARHCVAYTFRVITPITLGLISGCSFASTRATLQPTSTLFACDKDYWLSNFPAYFHWPSKDW